MTGLSPRRLREAWHCAMLHGEGILATILFYAWRALLEQQHASVSEASRWEELGGIPEIVNGQAGGRNALAASLHAPARLPRALEEARSVLHDLLRRRHDGTFRQERPEPLRIRGQLRSAHPGPARELRRRGETSSGGQELRRAGT